MKPKTITQLKAEFNKRDKKIHNQYRKNIQVEKEKHAIRLKRIERTYKQLSEKNYKFFNRMYKKLTGKPGKNLL